MKRNMPKSTKSLVVKVGTSVLATNGRFDRAMIQKIALELAPFLKKGMRIAIVSSGAIGAGMTILKEKERPKSMEGLQAAAAVGQRFLMQCYEEAFSKYGYSTAQVLLTWDDMTNPKRFLNAKRTLNEIQRRGLVPVINENDTVATDEIRFGDNDRLSSLLSILIEADGLVILSNTDGLFNLNTSERIGIVAKMDENIFSHVKDSKTAMTVGGMRSKLEAVRMCVEAGIPVFVANGKESKIVSKIMSGEDRGTYFMAAKTPKKQKKDWIYHFLDSVNLRPAAAK